MIDYDPHRWWQHFFDIKGSMVREIGTRARPELELRLGHAVFLDLHVKVRDKWRRDESMLERLGL